MKARAPALHLCTRQVATRKRHRLQRDVPLRDARLRCIPGVGQLFDVVDQAEELPLPIDFRAPAQGEPIEAFVVPHIGKHRLNRPEALGVLRAPRWRVDLRFHARRMRFLGRLGPPAKKRDLSRHGFLRRAQALRAQRAGRAVPLRATKLLRHEPFRHQMLPLAIERLAGGADTRPRLRVIGEIGRLKHRW